jgi:hypothetical protein
MTTLLSMSAGPASPPVPRPTRAFAWSGAVCLVVGSLATLIQWLLTPVDATLTTSDLVARVAAHHGAMGWALALDVPMLLVYPAVLYAGHLAHAGRSLLAGVATALCFVPMLAGVLLLGLDALLYDASTDPDRAAAVRIVDGYVNGPFVGPLTIVYLLTHAIGFVLLAVALRLVRAVPAWACVCIAVWPFLEMGGYAAGGKAVAALGYAALAAGSAAGAVALVRESGS